MFVYILPYVVYCSYLLEPLFLYIIIVHDVAYKCMCIFLLYAMYVIGMNNATQSMLIAVLN